MEDKKKEEQKKEFPQQQKQRVDTPHTTRR